MKVLIAAGGNVNQARTNGSTPLRAASRAGHTDTVRLLIQQPNIDLNKKAFNKSPLDFAKENNHADVVQLLMNAGAK